MEASTAARRIWGDAFTANFVAACRAEYASLAKAVSAEERARYLEG
jgi:glutamine synthetase